MAFSLRNGIACSLILVAGVIAGPKAVGQEAAAGANKPVVQGPAAPVTPQLEGIWAGVGYLDEAKLAEKLATMAEGPERAALVNKSATFLTIVAAIEFRKDGSLETDLEVTDAEGVPHNEPTKGTWSLIERKENRFLVELRETLEDKTERTSRRLIQFYEDGEHFALLMETDPVLEEFNPLVVMKRVRDLQIADAAQADPRKNDRK